MLRPVTYADTVGIVHPSDPAIDKQKSRMEEYEKNHDISMLVYKDGQTPTIFHVGALSAAQGDDLDTWTGIVEWDETGNVQRARSLRGEFDDGKKAIKAFRLCVRRIENMPDVECDERRGHDRTREGEMLSMSVMSKIPRQIAIDIGRIVLKLNKLEEPDRKNF